MAAASPPNQVTARIVFWGAEGAGKTASLQAIHAKLKKDNRGDLAQVPTRLDPSVSYETFPIQLGSIGGVRTQLSVVAVPGAPEHAHTRKQLLDEVDGVVLVMDAQESRSAANLEATKELRASLDAYGRSLDTIPLVILYNKRDLSDPYVIEDLHRRVGLPNAAVFETVANQGTGVLNALTTISKQVVRVMREKSATRPPAPDVALPAPVPVVAPSPPPIATPEPIAVQSPPSAAPIAREEPVAAAELISAEPIASDYSIMEAAILAEGDAADPMMDQAIGEAQTALDQPWSQLEAEAKANSGLRMGPDMRIVSVGVAERSGQRGLSVPIVLGNDDGESISFALTIQLDPLFDDETT